MPFLLRLHMTLFVLVLLLSSTPIQAQPPARAGSPYRVYLPLAVGGSRTPSPGAPVIEQFTASTAEGPMAAEVELRWRVRNATQLHITPHVGDVLGGGNVIVRPLATTTYTLTAANATGSVSATTTYTVNALPVPDPLSVRARPDAGRAVGASIGAAGGTVSATGADGTTYTLVVPPEALLYTEAVTLTPVAGIEGLPSQINNARAVAIEPPGLGFIEPATLTISPSTNGGSGTRSIGLAYEGSGSNFHLRRPISPPSVHVVSSTLAGGTSQLRVTEARSYGAATTSADDDVLAPLTPQTPTDPVDAVEHVDATANDLSVRRAVLIWRMYTEILRGELQAANANPDGPAPNDIDTATRHYGQWRGLVRMFGLDDALRPELDEARQLLSTALRKAGDLALGRCNQERPAQGFALQRFVAYAKRFGLTNTRTQLQEQLKTCWVFRLTFTSHMTEQAPAFGYEYDLQATLTLRLADDASRLVGTGLETYTASWTGEDNETCMFTVGTTPKTFDAESGQRGLHLRPVSRTSPAVKLSLTYYHNMPSETTTITCPSTPPITVPSTAWAQYFDQMHAHELASGSINAQQQAVTNEGIPPWSYHHTTTGPGGQAVVENTTITLQHTPGQ